MPGHQREQAEEPDDKRRRGQEEGTDAEPGVETGVPPKPPSSGTGNLGIGTGDKDAVETESPSGAPCKEAGKTPRAEPEMMPRMEAPYTGSPAADRRPVPADTDPPFLPSGGNGSGIFRGAGNSPVFRQPSGAGCSTGCAGTCRLRTEDRDRPSSGTGIFPGISL